MKESGQAWWRRLWLRVRPRLAGYLARVRRAGRRLWARYRSLGRAGRLAAYAVLFVVVFAGAFMYFSSQRGVVSPFPGDLQRMGDAGAPVEEGGAAGGTERFTGEELPPPTDLPDIPPAAETSAGGDEGDTAPDPAEQEAGDALSEPDESEETAGLEEDSLQWPSYGQMVRSYGLGQSPTFDDWRLHTGIDLQGTPGSEITAPAAGRVTSVEDTTKWGWRVTIESGDAVFVLAHLQEPAVEDGQQVAAGDRIGALGQPGLYEAGQDPHLHFEVHFDGTPEDPESYLPSRS